MTDRDPHEPLLAYGGALRTSRSIRTWSTSPPSSLDRRPASSPSIQGKFGGAGNPPVPPTRKGYATAYLWEETWARNSVLDLVRQFIHEVEEEDEKGRKTRRRFLIFPRYQQLDCVRKLVADARATGTGQRYLIQHSAGSGKASPSPGSPTSSPHSTTRATGASSTRSSSSPTGACSTANFRPPMRQFEQTLGVVENIDSTSRQLKDALESGKTIIVTTLQKFPVIAKEMGELPGKRFALIVDEAHSSQSGESTKSLKAVLARGLWQRQRRRRQSGDARGRAGEHDPGRDGEARAAPQPLDLRLHGHTEGEDARALRHEAPRQEGCAVPPLQHASGDRGGFHPRRADELHDLQRLWRLLKKVEDDPDTTGKEG